MLKPSFKQEEEIQKKGETNNNNNNNRIGKREKEKTNIQVKNRDVPQVNNQFFAEEKHSRPSR